VFVYDPTPDAIETVYATTDPQFIADSDPGRAIELFPVGYRSGFTNLGWVETSPFSLAPPVIAPVQGNRTAFAAEFDAVGNALDLSNQLKDRRSSPAAAVGLSTVAPGANVPVDTRFDFEVDLSVPGVRAYLQRSLAEGRVRFAITSLHQTNFDPENPGGGPGALTFPIFYTSENPLAQLLGLTPRMQLTVWVGSRADFDQSGTVNIFDLIAFLAAWNAGDPLTDIDGNGALSVFDIIGFLNEFNAG